MENVSYADMRLARGTPGGALDNRYRDRSMAAIYNYRAIEQKWQDALSEDKDFGACAEMESQSVGSLRMLLKSIEKNRKTINEDDKQDIIENYGYDTLYLTSLCAGADDPDSLWDDGIVDGVYRFLSRLFSMADAAIEAAMISAGEASAEAAGSVSPGELSEEMPSSRMLISLRHQMIGMITEKLNGKSYHTIVSAFMENINKLKKAAGKQGCVDMGTIHAVTRMIAPFAPYIGEELWHMMGNEDSVFDHEWPEYDEEAALDADVLIPLQINGKVRGRCMVPARASQDAALKIAKDVLGNKINGKIASVIYVPMRVINIIVEN